MLTMGDYMLNTDEKILKILVNEKSNGNKLLKHFHIQCPNKRVAEESNSIFVATVSSENNQDGLDFSSFRDLVEILIVTKQKDYKKAIKIIKIVSYEICRIIMNNREKFANKPVIRNVNPEFNNDFILTRGHILIEVNTEPETFELTDDEYNICDVYLNDVINHE